MHKISSQDFTFLQRMAMEFDNKEALERYLKEHPKANRNRHTVKKSPDVKAPETKSDNLESVPKQFREHVKGYNLDVVGEDYAQAAEIAKKISEGIDKSADICKLRPAVCEGNLGLSRDKMPQIPGDMSIKEMLSAVKMKPIDKNDPTKGEKPVDCDGNFVSRSKACPDEATRAKGKAAVDAGADPNDNRSVLHRMLETFKKEGVEIKKDSVEVGKLKATQSEIKAGKSFGMADAHLKGKFPNIGDQIVISSDGHILDGHHRWAALLTIDPSRKMNVIRVGIPMKEMLKRADELPGVYREDFQGKPIDLPADIKKRKEKYLKRRAK